MPDKKRFYLALATLVGTIIGVGLFGLPYAAAKSGFPIFILYFVFIGLAALAIHLFFGEVVIGTEGYHRLPGYAEKYLGPRFKGLAFIVKISGLFGALLAYLIVGGEFLANLFGGSVFVYTFLFFAVGSYIIWKDTKLVGITELVLLFLFIFLVMFFLIVGSPFIKLENLLTVNFKNLENIFFPYGIILFSIWGATVIPEVSEVLKIKDDVKPMRKVIIYSLVICLLVYFVFTLLVLGITGDKTSPEAMFGLKSMLGRGIISLGFIFGFITTFTSFITLGLSVKNTFLLDYKMPKLASWAIACFIPLILYIIGFKNFINVISLTGAVMVGLEGVLILLIYLKFKQKKLQLVKSQYLHLKYLASFLVVVLSLGVILEIFFFFHKL